MPFDIDNEARYLANKLDNSRSNEVVNRLQEDAQNIDPRAYAALLQTMNRYDRKGVGDDLVIVNNRDGSQEALIKPAPIDVGVASGPPQPREYYPQPQGYAPAPPRNDGCTALSAVAGGVVGNTFAPDHRRTAGTVIGALVGGVIGNDRCNR